MRSNFRHLRQYFCQMPALFVTFSHSVLYKFLSTIASKLCCEQGGGAFGENRATCGLDVSAHSLGSHRDSFGNFCHGCSSDTGGLNDLRDNRPFRLPTTNCTFVLLHHCRKK